MFISDNDPAASPFDPPMPNKAGERIYWENLYGSATGLVVSTAAKRRSGPLIVITTDTPSAMRMEDELRFFLAGSDDVPVLLLPDWETLPYDIFSPHQDIISQRLATLYRLPSLSKGILLIPVSTCMLRLPPRHYLDAHSLILDLGQRVDISAMRLRLESSGYQCVSQVMEHGEFAVRGSILDLFPMGSATPYRIDLFDEEIETLRSFDPETQRSLDSVAQVRLLPAKEFPLTKEAITLFRQQYRATFEGDPQASMIYRDISNGIAVPGVEYYLPLFFQQTQTLFDYLPRNCMVVSGSDLEQAADSFWREAGERYEERRHDIQRPLLAPGTLFLQTNELFAGLAQFPRVDVGRMALERTNTAHFNSRPTPLLTVVARSPDPVASLKQFLSTFSGRVLFVAETAGRRETLRGLLTGNQIYPAEFSDWQGFLASNSPVGMTVAPLDQGLLLDSTLAVITEAQLFGEHAMQRRRRKPRQRDSDAIIRNLTELNIGAPVVHEEHGVGRYLGLQTLKVGDIETEFLVLEYAGGDKLYVPVAALHLISRYTGAAPEQAPLHKLGSGQWQRAKHKAAEQVRDVAAELLDIYARRAARQGHAFPLADEQYAAFAAAFPFEETPDQLDAINAVISDMTQGKPMDRLVCGDVGFGKTEVAMRAAFIATQGLRQVAVLVPTTLLAQQHHQNFRDRFADWPVRIESLSRFNSKKEQDVVLKGIEDGTVDIVIGTHKLLQEGIKFKRLGLVIVDEEHRFGVRQKERFKALRAEVDVLNLTATPIPRSLNMALANLRELSIIATPPLKRLAVKTFIAEWNDTLVHEACLREIKRGGQVYFLHNEVDNIDKIAERLQQLVPDARVQVAHGQMRERDLERIMLDFYHQRFNILVCTTIIESGIDVPTANTIIINRADRFGLAQLHQLRGRVGRSHHRSYAYLIIPPRKMMTADAEKRLEAIESLGELGAGFTLATHDLEIRGAGELLGEEQSGQIHEIGFSLYTDLLERAVRALKSGQEPDLHASTQAVTEIDLHIPALIPEAYLPDVHSRLVLYKRIASANQSEELDELQVEMIDRFGLLPEPAKNLFRLAELRFKAQGLEIRKIEAGPTGGRIIFSDKPNIDPMTIIRMIQKEPKTYKLDGQDKLRFAAAMPNSGQRIDAVGKLLDRLST